MSKKSKASSKEKRLAKKRAIKQANKALYDSWRKSGQNTKSFRARKSSKKHLVSIVSHKDGFCGNIACKRCFQRIDSIIIFR